MCVCVCVCVYVCMHVCMYACMQVWRVRRGRKAWQVCGGERDRPGRRAARAWQARRALAAMLGRRARRVWREQQGRMAGRALRACMAGAGALGRMASACGARRVWRVLLWVLARLRCLVDAAGLETEWLQALDPCTLHPASGTRHPELTTSCFGNSCHWL